jgi:Flp pilus assembly protein TadB
MSNRTKVIIGGVVVGLIVLAWVPWWVTFLIIIGIPVAAYLTLDPSQRRRLRRAGRRQIGR